jgi:hypothetical protein
MSGLTACTVYEYALSASLLGDARVHQSMAAMEPHAPMLEHTHAPTDIRACEHSHAHGSARTPVRLAHAIAAEEGRNALPQVLCRVGGRRVLGVVQLCSAAASRNGHVRALNRVGCHSNRRARMPPR